VTEERANRKLTAIFSADMAGYGRLMADNEEATVRTINAYRDVITGFITGSRGRVAKLPSFNISLSAGYTSLADVIGQLAASVTAYGQAVWTAFQEVENALANERIFSKRQLLLEKVVDDNQNAYRLAKTQYEVGRIEVFDVLQIQARVLAARSALIRIQNERLATRINLHLALGGSFEVKDGQ